MNKWDSKEYGYQTAVKAIQFFWLKRHDSPRARLAIRRAIAQARRCR